MTNADVAAMAAQKGSLARGWPALVLTVLIALAAVYSFSHRPPPPFPPTQVRPDGLLINALAQQGGRFLAAGEQGRILIADAADGPWREATVKQQRDSTLTAVAFVGDGIAIAVGHDNWILRSEDRGETWSEVAFAAEESEPLLGVAGPYDGTLYAYGAFGTFMLSGDQGRTWQQRPLVDEDAEAEPEAPAMDPESENYDPFAAYTANGGGDGGLAERHLNAMLRASDGTLWLAGERGLLARSGNAGESWKMLEPVYAGSWFGMLELPSKVLLVFGMRGNAYVSRDRGASWTKSEVPMPLSLFGGAIDAEGNVVLVGASDAIFKSTDDGATFELVSQKGRRGISAVLPLDGGGWLTGGEAGVARQWPGVGKIPESQAQSEGDRR